MGSITGIVRNARNLPVEEVNLVIVAGPSHADIAALTDANGLFSFSNLRPGYYIIRAYGRVVSDEISVRVVRNKVPFVEIWLDTAAPPPQDAEVVEEEYYFGEEYPEREGF